MTLHLDRRLFKRGKVKFVSPWFPPDCPEPQAVVYIYSQADGVTTLKKERKEESMIIIIIMTTNYPDLQVSQNLAR